MDKGKELKGKKWYKKAENWWISVGFIIAIIAIAVPFLLMFFFRQDYALKNFEQLGAVGDYFGGTTIVLLSLASIIFVTAAIIMQKEELELQRKEVEKTREEYQITNATMKKQQFDSTFFNMINLHHDITKDIVIEGAIGRAVMKEILKKLNLAYNNEVYNTYIIKLKEEIIQGDKILLDDLIRKEFFELYLNDFIANNQPEFYFLGDEVDTSDLDNFHESIKMGTNTMWNSRKKELLERYENVVYMNDDSYASRLTDLDFKNASRSYSTLYTDKFNKEFNNEPLKELKVAAFEKVYNDYESQLGHYFRNLYRIVKLIHDEKFNENEQINIREKRKYRGILRAQLSSYELLVIFYNLVYSSKGEKFKRILIDTHFFDDHLSKENFLWPNDKFELEQMDPAIE